MDHDVDLAVRVAAGLGWWWFLRGRLAGRYPLLREAAGRAAPGSDPWCAVQFFAGYASFTSGDPAAALGHFTALRDVAAAVNISVAGLAGALGAALGGAVLSAGFGLAWIGPAAAIPALAATATATRLSRRPGRRRRLSLPWTWTWR